MRSLCVVLRKNTLLNDSRWKNLQLPIAEKLLGQVSKYLDAFRRTIKQQSSKLWKIMELNLTDLPSDFISSYTTPCQEQETNKNGNNQGREDILPKGVITMNCSIKLGLSCIPLVRRFERNVRSRMMHHCESTHLQKSRKPN